LRWQSIRPAWLLAGLILLGFLIGLVGDLFKVCPPSIASICDNTTNATYFLAQNNGMVVYLHQYYQLFTSILVTDSPLDAGFNLIAVLIFDRLTDDVFNKSRYVLIFFITALLGNLLTLFQGPNYASAGASGGIFGLVAAAFSYSWAKERRIEISTLAFFLLIFIGSSFLISDVNYIAHLGGAIGGFAAGPMLYENLKQKLADYSETSKSSRMTEFITLALILGLTIFSIVQFAFFIS
jgi:membrane associated rhomboid family serine protease